MRFVFALLVASSAQACTVAPARVEKALTGDSNPMPEYLVVLEDGEKLHTLHIRDAPGGESIRVADLSQAYVSAGDQVWGWSVDVEETTQADCACHMELANQGREPSQGECLRSAEVKHAKMTKVGTNAEEWHPFPFDESLEGAEWQTEYTFHGVIGTLATVSRCVTILPCLAPHPDYSCEYATFDLMGPARVDPSLLVEKVESVAELFTSEEEINPEEIALVGVYPEFDDRRRGTFTHHYTVPTCYACSDGGWSAYTLSARVAGQELGSTLARFGEPPAGVVKGLEGESRRLLGWSRLSVEAARKLP